MNRLLSRNIIRLIPSLNLNLARVNSRDYSDGFTYLFPDTPNIDASTNYLLNVPKQGELIDFRKVDPHQSFKAVLKTLFELEGCFEELRATEIDKLDDELTFEKVYNEIDKYFCSLNYSFSIFDLMFNLNPSRFMLRKNGNVQLMKAYNDVKKSAYQSKTIFKIMLELDKQGDKLKPEQRKVVRKYITEGKLNGLHLRKNLAIDQIKKSISKYEQDYISNVSKVSKDYVQKVINPDYVKTVPNHMRWIIEGKSKVNLYLSPVIYEHFLSNCDDQHARYEYWFAYTNRASFVNCERRVSNNLLIDEIVCKRRSLAKHLNFLNFIEYTLQTRTLDSIIAIKELIENLFEQTRDVYKHDLSQIVKFASTQLDFRSKGLNQWDLPYFKTQLKNRELSYIGKDLNHYFPVTKVIGGVFKFLQNNFNIQIEKTEDDCLTNDNPLGDTLEYYRMYHNNEFVGSFYMNLHSKMKIPQVRNITDRCDQLDVKPIAGIFLNYNKPFEGQQLTMSFLEVVSLFRSFGIILDHLLPKNTYAEISGVNSINEDFKDLTANLFTLFAIHDYDIIKECSEHVFSGDQLSSALHRNIVDGFLKFQSINLTEEIYRSALDFALYTQTESSLEITTEVYNKYMNPFTFGKDSYHLCSDFQLMLSANVGAYYSKLYSQVLAADLFMLTHDNHGKNRFDLLNSYVNNFLLSEKGTNNLEAFRKIRGRDFSLKPFLILNQYQNSQQNVDKVKVSSS